MARLISLSDIATRVRRRADIEYETDRFPNSEVYDEVNASLAELHLMLVSVRGADYFEKLYRVTGTITGSGTSPPTIVVKGVPAEAYASGFKIDILTVTGGNMPATIRFSTDGGTTWSSTATLVTTTEVPLPGTGMRVTFPSGTYNADNQWTFTPSNFATVASTASYALPDDFLELGTVEATVGGHRLQLDRYGKEQRPWLLDLADWYGLDRVPRYRIRGDARREGQGVIDFAPVPRGAYTMDILYCPQAEKFDITGTSGASIYAGTEGTTLHLDSGHEEWLILHVAIKCMDKDDLDRTKHVQRLAQLTADIRDVGQHRDASMPERVADRSEQWTGHNRVLW